MTPSEAMESSIEDVAHAVTSGRCSAVRLVEHCLEAIADRDGALGGFVHVCDTALEQARVLDAAAGAGRVVGPLHGIPIAVKDNFLTADMPTTAGTNASIDFPREDGSAVRRLRRAGAILLGKTRMHEFAWGMETPPARNPHDPSRVPGGSSGGSGIAVAAGFAMAALGSDTGGSIRIPASLCGTVGFKPTFGLVGRSGIVPHSWSLDHAGPLTRRVADAALLTDVMSGPDPDDPGSSGRRASACGGGVGRAPRTIRVGVCRNHFFETLDGQVEAAVERTIDALASAGHPVVEFEIPELSYGLGAIFAIELASSTTYHLRHIEAGHLDAYGDDVRTLVEIGHRVSAVDYLQAERYRSMLAARFANAFRSVDVVVGPTMPITAWKAGQKTCTLGGRTESVLEASWRFTYPWNLLGLPAMSVPCGTDDSGLPIGFQIAGRAFDEATVVALGVEVESRTASSRGAVRRTT